ncbi:MAG: response regulator [Candidatus Ancaeobacter aquaticus]|nr:response regulator [Candidatus Ancaeobacter aquaticus]
MNNDIKILVIDDDENILSLMSEIFRTDGYIVSTALNGEKGLECIEKEKFDLVFVDLMMPGWDGLETIKRIRKINITVSIIIITAYGKTKDAVIEAERYCVFDYVTKPFDIDYLLSLVKYVIQRSKYNRMPYKETMQNYYWKNDVSQKQLTIRKWKDLKEQVKSSAITALDLNKTIEKQYIKTRATIKETARFYYKSVLRNKYILVGIICILIGVVFGLSFNMSSMTKTDAYNYALKMRKKGTVVEPKKNVTLSDFYGILKSINYWMHKDVEQERKHFNK